MANWCSNTVEFIGEHSQFEELEKLFLEMAKKEKKEEKGQLPAFTGGDSGYLFEIRWVDGILYYETKWSPNSSVIVSIACYYNVGFTHSFSEPGNGVFGEVTLKDGTLTDTALEYDDLAAYEFNEESGMYRFENQNYECCEDIQEILLNRKKAIGTTGLNINEI